MPLIGMVGRRNWKVRLLNGIIHVVLIAGAVTMVFPFIIMLAGSVKCRVDFVSMSLIPEYFFGREMLFRKYANSRHNEELAYCQDRYVEYFPTFEVLPPPVSVRKAASGD